MGPQRDSPHNSRHLYDQSPAPLQNPGWVMDSVWSILLPAGAGSSLLDGFREIRRTTVRIRREFVRPTGYYLLRRRQSIGAAPSSVRLGMGEVPPQQAVA